MNERVARRELLAGVGTLARKMFGPVRRELLAGVGTLARKNVFHLAVRSFRKQRNFSVVIIFKCIPLLVLVGRQLI